MSTSSSVIKTWLEDFLYFYPDALTFGFGIDDHISIEADTAINECQAKDKSLLIAWSSPSICVVETIEPIRDEEAKSDLGNDGQDWQQLFEQELEVVVSSQASEEWLDSLSESATAVAMRDFEEFNLSLYVNDDRSNIEQSVVLFCVGGINRMNLDRNRAAVIQWAKQVFVPLLAATPINPAGND